MFGIPNADVAGHAFRVAVTGPGAKGPCHVFELPMAFQLVRGEAGDSWEVVLIRFVVDIYMYICMYVCMYVSWGKVLDHLDSQRRYNLPGMAIPP